MVQFLRNARIVFSQKRPIFLFSAGIFILVSFQNCNQFSGIQVSTAGLTINNKSALSVDISTKKVWFQQSTSDRVQDILFINQTNPTGGFGISQWFSNPNGPADVPILWNVGDFTGFYPANKSSAQLGVNNASYGSTSVQVEAGVIGLMIHTKSAETATTNSGTIFGIVSGASLNVTPFTNANQLLVFSMDLQVSGAYNQAPAVGYATQYFFFVDSTCNKGFWFGSTVYDPRGAQEAVMFDGAFNGDTPGTQAAIVLAVAGQNGLYSTALGGANILTTPSAGYNRFLFGISANNLKNAISAIKQQYPSQYSKLSDDPSVYYVNGFNFDPEIAKVNGGEGWLGLAYKNISIYTISPMATEPAPTVASTPIGTPTPTSTPAPTPTPPAGDTSNSGFFCSVDHQILWSCGQTSSPGAGWVNQNNGCYHFDNGLSKSCYFCSATNHEILWRCNLTAPPGAGWVDQQNSCYHFDTLNSCPQ